MDSFSVITNPKPAKLDKPFFYKEDSDAKAQMKILEEFSKTCPKSVKEQVDRDMKMLSYGIYGEDQVAFELKTSYLPIIVLHDLHIEYEGLSAQMDYLVITRKFTLVIECKNLIGNIEVTSEGEFIRTTEFGGHYKKEGIYSPITQNIRHIEMIRKFKLDSRTNFISRALFEKFFDDNYKSVVVLANPKTIINLKHANKEVKSKIIRCDQLIDYIKKLLKESTLDNSPDKTTFAWAETFLRRHTPNTTDYLQKYGKNVEAPIADKPSPIVVQVEPAVVAPAIVNVQPTPDIPVATPPVTASEAAEPVEIAPTQPSANLEDTAIYIALKKYRYDTSKEEGVKPYFLFNNAQMEDIISKMPGTLEDLKKISGFGDVKCQKYGEAILEIVRANSQ